jgi:formylglycine-generating enzyme required for sulfatase activity
MVVIPAGKFMMGSPAGQGDLTGREYPLHPVTIGYSFAVGETEVTFAEWDACAVYGPCDPEITSEWGRGRLPVINVTWYDAKRYVDWLSHLTGQPYRLLSESEYEYAARGGTKTPYPWGYSIGDKNAQCGECLRTGVSQTALVASFARNRFGLYDMIGNVFEWVEDCFHGNFDNAPKDGSAWQTKGCLRRVVRGGAWISRASALRSAFRDWHSNQDRKDYLGFRVARAIQQ